MKFVRLDKNKGSGGPSISSRYAYIIAVKDVEYYPETDDKGVRLIGDLVPKEDCSLMPLYLTKPSQEFSYETIGEDDEKTFKVSFSGTHPGTELEAMEFAKNNIEQGYLILIPPCKSSEPWKLLGEICNPLIFTSSHKANKDGSKFTFNFEQRIGSEFIYFSYYGIVSIPSDSGGGLPPANPGYGFDPTKWARIDASNIDSYIDQWREKLGVHEPDLSPYALHNGTNITNVITWQNALEIYTKTQGAQVEANLAQEILDRIAGDQSLANFITDLNGAVTTLQNWKAQMTDPDADAVINTLSEVLAMFQNVGEGADLLAMFNAKVNITDIVDNLNSVLTNAPLSANQGRALRLLIESVPDNIAAKYVPYTGATKDVQLGAKGLQFTSGAVSKTQNGMRAFTNVYQGSIISASTGILSLKFPRQRIDTATMFDVEISIYGYGAKYLGKIWVSFYAFWNNTIHSAGLSALISASANFPTDKINIGIDASDKICINIGESSTFWNGFVSFEVTNLRAKYSDYDYNFSQGWSHAIETDTSSYKSLVNVIPDRFAESAHTHEISDVNSLQDELAGKLNTSGGTVTGAITHELSGNYPRSYVINSNNALHLTGYYVVTTPNTIRYVVVNDSGPAKFEFNVTELKVLNGTVVASSFYESSLREHKDNIAPFNRSGIDLMKNIDIVTYDRKDGIKNKIGIIADDAPAEFLSEDGNEVDLYKTIFIQAKAIQELIKKIENVG